MFLMKINQDIEIVVIHTFCRVVFEWSVCDLVLVVVRGAGDDWGRPPELDGVGRGRCADLVRRAGQPLHPLAIPAGA